MTFSQWWPCPGFLKSALYALVAGRRAAKLDEEVEVAVVVLVGEGDAVPFLEVAGARADVVTSSNDLPSTFLNIRFGIEPLIRHVAGAQVDVEKAIVVDVAEIAPMAPSPGRVRPLRDVRGSRRNPRLR